MGFSRNILLLQTLFQQVNENSWERLRTPIIVIIVIIVLNVLLIRLALWIRRRMNIIAEATAKRDHSQPPNTDMQERNKR